jgi:hypothetical protein
MDEGMTRRGQRPRRVLKPDSPKAAREHGRGLGYRASMSARKLQARNTGRTALKLGGARIVRAHGRVRQATCRCSPAVNSRAMRWYDRRGRVCRPCGTHGGRERRGRESAEEDRGCNQRPSAGLGLCLANRASRNFSPVRLQD